MSEFNSLQDIVNNLSNNNINVTLDGNTVVFNDCSNIKSSDNSTINLLQEILAQCIHQGIPISFGQNFKIHNKDTIYDIFDYALRKTSGILKFQLNQGMDPIDRQELRSIINKRKSRFRTAEEQSLCKFDPLVNLEDYEDDYSDSIFIAQTPQDPDSTWEYLLEYCNYQEQTSCIKQTKKGSNFYIDANQIDADTDPVRKNFVQYHIAMKLYTQWTQAMSNKKFTDRRQDIVPPESVSTACNQIIDFVYNELNYICIILQQCNAQHCHDCANTVKYRLALLQDICKQFQDIKALSTILALINQTDQKCRELTKQKPAVEVKSKSYNDIGTYLNQELIKLEKRADYIQLNAYPALNIDNYRSLQEQNINEILDAGTFYTTEIIQLDSEMLFMQDMNSNVHIGDNNVDTIILDVPELLNANLTWENVARRLEYFIAAGNYGGLCNKFPHLNKIIIPNLDDKSFQEIMAIISPMCSFLPQGFTFQNSEKLPINFHYQVNEQHDLFLLPNSTKVTVPDPAAQFKQFDMRIETTCENITQCSETGVYVNLLYASSCNNIESITNIIQPDRFKKLEVLSIRAPLVYKYRTYNEAYKLKNYYSKSDSTSMLAQQSQYGTRILDEILKLDNLSALKVLRIDLTKPDTDNLNKLDKLFAFLAKKAPQLQEVMLERIHPSVMHDVVLLYNKYFHLRNLHTYMSCDCGNTQQNNRSLYVIEFGSHMPGTSGCVRQYVFNDEQKEWVQTNREYYQHMLVAERMEINTNDESISWNQVSKDKKGQTLVELNNTNLSETIQQVMLQGTAFFQNTEEIKINLRLDNKSAYLLKELWRYVPKGVRIQLGLYHEKRFELQLENGTTVRGLAADRKRDAMLSDDSFNALTLNDMQELLDIVFSPDNTADWREKQFEIAIPKEFAYEYDDCQDDDTTYIHSVKHELTDLCLQKINTMSVDALKLNFAVAASKDNAYQAVCLPSIDNSASSNMSIPQGIDTLVLDIGECTINVQNSEALATWLKQQYGDSLNHIKHISITHTSLLQTDENGNHQLKTSKLLIENFLNKLSTQINSDIVSLAFNEQYLDSEDGYNVGSYPVYYVAYNNLQGVKQFVNTTRHRAYYDWSVEWENKSISNVNDFDDASINTNCNIEITTLACITQQLLQKFNETFNKTSDRDSSQCEITVCACLDKSMNYSDESVKTCIAQFLQYVFQHHTVCLENNVSEQTGPSCFSLLDASMPNLSTDNVKSLVLKPQYSDKLDIIFQCHNLQQLVIDYNHASQNASIKDKATCLNEIKKLLSIQHSYNLDAKGECKTKTLLDCFAKNIDAAIAFTFPQDSVQFDDIEKLLQESCAGLPDGIQIQIEIGGETNIYYVSHNELFIRDDNTQSLKKVQYLPSYSIQSPVVTTSASPTTPKPQTELIIHDDETLRFILFEMRNGRLNLANTNLVLSPNFTINTDNCALVKELFLTTGECLRERKPSDCNLCIHCGLDEASALAESDYFDILLDLCNIPCTKLDLDGNFAAQLCARIPVLNQKLGELHKKNTAYKPAILQLSAKVVSLSAEMVTLDPGCTSKITNALSKDSFLKLDVNSDNIDFVMKNIEQILQQGQEGKILLDVKDNSICSQIQSNLSKISTPKNLKMNIGMLDSTDNLIVYKTATDGTLQQTTDTAEFDIYNKFIKSRAKDDVNYKANAIHIDNKQITPQITRTMINRPYVERSKDELLYNPAGEQKYEPALSVAELNEIATALGYTLTPEEQTKMQNNPVQGAMIISAKVAEEAEIEAVKTIVHQKTLKEKYSDCVAIKSGCDIIKKAKEQHDAKTLDKNVLIKEILKQDKDKEARVQQKFIKETNGIFMEETFKKMSKVASAPGPIKADITLIDVPIYQETAKLDVDMATGAIIGKEVLATPGKKSVVYRGLSIREDGVIKVVDQEEMQKTLMNRTDGLDGIIFFRLDPKEYPGVGPDTELCFKFTADHLITIGLAKHGKYDTMQELALLSFDSATSKVEAKAVNIDRIKNNLLKCVPLAKKLDTVVENCKNSDFTTEFCNTQVIPDPNIQLTVIDKGACFINAASA